MQNDYEIGSLDQFSTNFSAAKLAAERLKELYRAAGVSLNRQCSLGRLIQDAIELADSWEAGAIVDDTDPEPLIRGQHLDKIAWAALPLASVLNKKMHLWALKKGTLDPHDRSQSPAKDKLWELELWTQLNEKGIPTALDEPDLVVSTKSGGIGIACKRIYSVDNARNAMSDGVSQVKKFGSTGVLAVSIDDLAMPASHVLVAPDIAAAAGRLNEFNREFLNYFHEQLSTYLASGRIAAVLASSSAPVYLANEGIRDCRQTQMWVHPYLDAKKKAHISEFHDMFFRAR